MPALLFMGLGTFGIAYTILPSDLFKDFGLSLVNVYSFTSNIYIYFTSGYFSTVADEKPLLHTWSLAVEEQYYLVFPLLLMLLFKKARKYTLAVISILFICSLLASHHMTHNGHKEAGFYLISSRAWELLAGSVLVFTNLSTGVKDKGVVQMLSIIGLLMLLFSFVVFDKYAPLPGLFSLIPVIGTMLLIVFATSSTVVGKMLSNKWLVFVGLISYSLYLWHQPILAFTKLKTIGHPTYLATISALVISFLLAIISWKFVEAPFRNKAKTSRGLIFGFSTIGISMSIVAGLVVYEHEGLPSRFSNKINYTDISYSPKRKACHASGLDYLKPDNGCRYSDDTEVTWAVMGDSHGVELAYSMADVLKKKGEGVLHLTNSACPAAAFMELAAPPGCSDWSKDAVNTIVNDKKIDKVILIYRYSYHFFGDHLANYPELPNRSPIMYLPKTKRKLYAQNVREYYWESFNQTVQSLKSANKKVFVVYPIPELPLHITKMIAPVTIFSSKPTINPEVAVPLEYYKRRNQYVLNKLNTLNYDKSLIAVKPSAIFCADFFCSAAENSRSYYADDDHLSVFGAKKLAIEITRLNSSSLN